MGIIDHNALADRALATAQKSLAVRFAGAAFAFVGGSIMRGQGTVASDIDMIVVFPRLERAWRESFVEDEFPVEVFVHDPQTLAYFLDEGLQNGFPVMINMVASGRIIGSDIDLAQAMQAKAAEIIARGPRPLIGPDYDALRYRVSDLADDLRGDRPPAEIRAIAAHLYQQLADLMLLGRGAWTGRGKWAPRLLLGLDRTLAERFDDAFRRAAGGDCAPLLALAEAELALHGGHYFAGYKQEASLAARCTESIWVPS